MKTSHLYVFLLAVLFILTSTMQSSGSVPLSPRTMPYLNDEIRKVNKHLLLAQMINFSVMPIIGRQPTFNNLEDFVI